MGLSFAEWWRDHVAAAIERQKTEQRFHSLFRRPRRVFPEMPPGRRALVISGLVVSALLFLCGFVFMGYFWRLSRKFPEVPFAQPSRLVWTASPKARERAIDAVSQAAPTLLAAAGRRDGEAPLDWWRRAFTLTYSAELRAERKGRATSVVDTDPARYERFSGPAIAAMPALLGRQPSWARRRLEGKALSVIRLAKASLTFAGGAEYIAWKINRHAGADIKLKAWQRRHPLLAGLSLLPRLLRSGAVR